MSLTPVQLFASLTPIPQLRATLDTPHLSAVLDEAEQMYASLSPPPQFGATMTIPELHALMGEGLPIPGPVGPPGPEGPAGPQGIQGVEGPIGPEGPPGTGIAIQGTVPSSGDLPVSGAPGDAWIAADTGHLWTWDEDTGTWIDAGLVQGPPGPAGPQGPQGVQGIAGPQGTQGVPGPVGATGAIGPEGPEGDPGPQGIQGPQGTQGLTGAAGPVGPQGEIGPTGATGSQGIQGIPGTPGVAGATGPAGATGAQGPQGVKGDTGATGSQGPAGATGSQGIQGIPGLPNVIQDEGTPLTVRATLNFTGAGVTATDDGTRTVVTIPGGGGGGAVDSVFGRIGVVVAASGDYTAAQVTNAVSVLGSYADPVWITSLAYSKLTGVPSSFTPAAHVHAAADTTSGVFAVARLGTGTPGVTNYLRGDGAWTVPAFAPTVHTHAAADTISGVFAVARLGSGTPSASNWLRGDGAWTALPASAVTSVFTRTGAVVAAANDYTAAQVTNAVSTLGSYADPSWITSLAYSKLTGVPSTFTPAAHVHAAADITTGVMAVARLGTGTPSAANYLRGDGAWTAAPASAVTSVFTRTGAVVAATGDYTAAQVTNAVSTIGAYADPAWITTLAYAKITGAPTIASIQTPWLQDIDGGGFKLHSTGNVGIGNTAAVTTGSAGVHLMVGSTTAGTPGHVTVSTNAGSVGAMAGTFNFANYNTAGAEKRIAAIGGVTDGTLDSGYLSFFSGVSGVLWERMRITSAGAIQLGAPVLAATITIPSDGAADSGAFVISTRNLGTLAERVRVSAAGNVGIGASPLTRLHVKGSPDANRGLLTLEATYNNAGLSFYTSGAGMLNWQISSNYLSAGGLSFLRSTSDVTAPTVGCMEITADGTPKLWLGGSLKTLSVDGSGFVKAA